MKEIKLFENEFDENGALEIFTSADAEVFRIFLEHIYSCKATEIKELTELRKTVPCKYHVKNILSRMHEAGLIVIKMEFISVSKGAGFQQNTYYEISAEGAEFFEQFLINA
ncbi:MAG: hypothetical protein U5L10_03825 [Candidatus Moranbacteria bacterium]|nr:hypothetical protein [Candidatus Moranbacteria bacterium]